MITKGQISTEYLVNMTIVMLVALIVITLVVGANPLSGGVTLTQSKNYWQTTAPFTISEWKYAHKTLTLKISNMEGNKLILSEIFINGRSILSSSSSFNSGESKELIATMQNGCGDGGDSFELSNIHIIYSKEDIGGFTQIGKKSIMGLCSHKFS
jgi:hypothetical protein